MKNILLILLLISGITFGQKKKAAPIPKKLTEIEAAQKKAQKYFEENIVKDFKDPYSYELKKIWTEPVTSYMHNTAYIENLGKYIVTEKTKKIQDSLMTVTSAMSDEEKNKIKFYIVHIDAYGANSFGNKVLGRYSIEVSPNGEVLDYKRE